MIFEENLAFFGAGEVVELMLIKDAEFRQMAAVLKRLFSLERDWAEITEL